MLRGAQNVLVANVGVGYALTNLLTLFRLRRLQRLRQHQRIRLSNDIHRSTIDLSLHRSWAILCRYYLAPLS
jgi:hypothetical protein